MDLYITFTGLCLFVRDPDESKMHVLLPSTDAEAGSTHGDSHESARATPHDDTPMVEHLATLNYAGGIPDLDMKKWSIDLSGLRGTYEEARPPSTIIDVGKLVNKTIDEEQLSPSPRDTVASRVTLPLVKRFERGEIAEWTVEHDNGTTEDVILTHDVTCVVEGITLDKFEWKLQELSDSPETVPLPAPRPTGNTVALFVRHLPAGPATLGWPHFHMYYKLFKGNTKGPKLKLKALPASASNPGTRGTLEAKSLWGGSPFNCMLAQSDPG